MLAIELLDMRFYAHHGCFDEERQIGTHFSVDVQVEAPGAQVAISSDRLEDALNYQEVYNIVALEMRQPSNLLEHVAGRIIKQLKAHFPQTGKIKVGISKLNPPLGGPVGASRVVISTE